MKKHTAQTNTKFNTNTVANGMSWKKIIAQPSVRHAPFAKEKNQSVQIQKNVEELKDMQEDRGDAEIFTLNTPTKTREKI